MRILTIARNTFREAVRDRVLYNLVLFVLLITASAIFLGELTAGQEARTIVDFGLGAMLVFGGSLAITIWGAIALIFLELAILTAVAILFSSFSSPALSALLTFFIFIIGNFTQSLRDFAANLGSEFTKRFFDALYYLLPNLSFYSFRVNAAHGDVPPLNLLGGAFLYAVVYIAVLLYITVFIFNRRNFK